jgi:Ca2+-binding RTX toxin-like protein
MSKVGIGVLAGSAVILGAAVSSAQPAPAAVYLSGTVLRHIATDGQTNVVTISDSGSRVIVKDVAGLAAGEGCTQTNAMTVSCQRPNTFVLDLKDGNDIVTNNSTVTIFAYGGAGNDVLTGGSGRDGLFGDDGNDVVTGNGNSDFLSGGSGNDVINGGAGDDQIDDPEGNDTIVGGAGNDQIADYGGVDTIKGEAGDDTIFSLDNTRDVIDCGPGSDSYGLDPIDLRSSCETSLN